MKKYMLVKILLVILIQLYLTVSFGQKKDESNEVFFIAITEFNNLVLAIPNGVEDCEKGSFITEKENLLALEKLNPIDKKYLIFYPGCYNLIGFPSQINEYIIPNIYNDSISNILKSNPKKMNLFCPDNEISNFVYLENFRYLEFSHKKFMILLVPLKLYHQMRDRINTHNTCKLFDNEPTKDGIYIKVLIEICD